MYVLYSIPISHEIRQYHQITPNRSTTSSPLPQNDTNQTRTQTYLLLLNDFRHVSLLCSAKLWEIHIVCEVCMYALIDDCDILQIDDFTFKIHRIDSVNQLTYTVIEWLDA